MKITEEKNIPGMILLCDFEKAFDTISWNFIYKALNQFNFGPSLQKWIQTLYKRAYANVQLSGFLSEPFTINRVCRQGDPLSPYIFILSAEILSIKIRNNKNIKGIKIDSFEYELTQFADDTFLLLDGSKSSLDATLTEMDSFAKISGLKLNYNKTKVVWIGSKKYTTEAINTKWKLVWGDTRFKLLGLFFDVDLDMMPNINYKEKIEKMKKIISNWTKRVLTFYGRIVVIKSLIIPLFIHLFSSLPNPDNNTFRAINNILYEYL